MNPVGVSVVSKGWSGSGSGREPTQVKARLDDISASTVILGRDPGAREQQAIENKGRGGGDEEDKVKVSRRERLTQ